MSPADILGLHKIFIGLGHRTFEGGSTGYLGVHRTFGGVHRILGDVVLCTKDIWGNIIPTQEHKVVLWSLCLAALPALTSQQIRIIFLHYALTGLRWRKRGDEKSRFYPQFDRFFSSEYLTLFLQTRCENFGVSFTLEHFLFSMLSFKLQVTNFKIKP